MKTTPQRPQKPLKPLVVARQIQEEALVRQQKLATPPVWRTRKLVNLEHLRSYLSSLVNRVEAGLIDDQKAARLANIAQIMAGVIKASEVDVLAAKLASLEKRLGDIDAS